jgi:hypothetical protein
MRAWFLVALAAIALLAAGCGGGGSSAPVGPQPETTQSYSLGLVRGDAPTMIPLLVTKPFPDAGTVELAEAPQDAFTPLADTLPMTLAAGDKATIRVTFTPPAAAANAHQGGTIRLVFRPKSGVAYPVTLYLDAEIEKPSARLVQTAVDLGDVAVGETVPLNVTFENLSAVTPITIQSAAVGEGDFAIDGDHVTIPMEVAPGASYQIKVLYKADAETVTSSLLSVYHSASPEPLTTELDAAAIPARVTLELGSFPLDPVTRETDWIDLDVSASAVGILLEVWGDPLDSVIDLVTFEGPSGKAMSLGWLYSYPAGGNGFLTVEIPDANGGQLEPGGGTYRFRLRDEGAVANALVVRATISQRRFGTVSQGTLDLRVFLANGLSLTDRTHPMSDPKMATVIKTIDAILGASGVRLGDVSFSELQPPFDVLTTEEDVQNLFAVNTAALDEGTLSLFLVDDIAFDGVTGFAGASPGPMFNGLPFSGVVVEYDSANGTVVGATAAHEIGHFLGGHGTGILPGTDAAQPMLRHPILDPGLPETLISPTGTYQQVQVLVGSMPPAGTWCGTCMHPPVR